jgi:hypothetical protein
VAAEQVLEKGFQAQRAFDGPLCFRYLVSRQFSPAGPDRRIISQAAQKDFDLVERETHVACETDEQHAVNGFRGISALPASAVRRREQAYPFVVANCRSAEAGTFRKLSDLHFSLDAFCRKLGLDLKLTSTFSMHEWLAANRKEQTYG